MKTNPPTSVDEARLRPHLRKQKPTLVIAPDNGTTHIQTLQLGGKRSSKTPIIGEPGDLRGIPVVGARGVGGVSPGTQPERRVIGQHGDWSPRRDQAA